LAQDTWELGLNKLSNVLECLWEVIGLLGLKNLRLERHDGGCSNERDERFHFLMYFKLAEPKSIIHTSH
jgi:hypothetical protein